MICKIAFTYVGAVIGAGFASGQEIFQFFIKFGGEGVVGLIMAGVLFVVGGVIILWLAQRIQVNYYHEIFYQLLGKKIGFIIDVLYIIMVLGSISVMLAGSGTIFQQVLGLRYSIGVLVTLAVAMITIFAGVEGIFLLNTILIPGLIVVIIYTSLAKLGIVSADALVQGECAFQMPWYMSGILYVSFNLFISIAIMTTIGREVTNQKNLILGGMLGGGLLMTILLVMGMAMFTFFGQIQGVDMPMLVIANFSGPMLHLIYMIGLWCAMVTTAVAHTYGFIHRVMPLFKLGFYNSCMLTIVVVLPLTRFGFANLVKYMYPVYGVISLVVLVLMVGMFYRQQLLRR